MTHGPVYLADIMLPPPLKRWGQWKYVERNLTLVWRGAGGRGCYELDLERITSSAEMLDWIFQVHRKAWADDRTIADLLRAFEDLFHPQRNLCSWGASRTINPKQLLTGGSR